jgi:hypothetical protein
MLLSFGIFKLFLVVWHEIEKTKNKEKMLI